MRTQQPTERTVYGTVVLRSGARRDAYRRYGITYFLPVGANQSYRRAPKTLALTFKAQED